ncbi:Long-chain-aldehyde dehydrogenase [Pseudomonas aeruginosa]|nr:Long-chain-aldehyde dehydrogenase [Pseudomonas aeruginosa]
MIYAAPGTPGAVVTFKPRYGNYIGGEFVPPVKGQYFTNTSPVNGQPIAEFPRSTAEDIDKALDAAHAAADAWGRTSVQERSNILLKIADRIEQNLELLAVTETWDNGKAVRETLNADIPLAADHFRYFAGCIRAQEGSAAEINDSTVAYHIHEPLGVVGQIIPWNFPLLMAAWKLAPALAAGNCVVLKPAEQTPLGICVLLELIGDLLPPGVLNVVQGFGREAGEALATSKRIAKIAFTGSTPVGSHILARGGEHHSLHRRAGRQEPEHLFRRHHAGRAGVHREGRRGPGAGLLQPGRCAPARPARWSRSRSTRHSWKRC